MATGVIYKYTSPSGKSYIGQTVKSLQQRARIDGKGYKNCPVFYRAIEKYGFSAFECQILKEITIENPQELGKQLDYWEQYYIAFYNTLSPNGYNIRAGGDTMATFSKDSLTHLSGSQHHSWREDIDDSKIIEMYQMGKTLKEISEELDLARETVKRHIQDKGILREKKYNCPVVKLDKKGNIIGKWPSASEAERQEKVGQNTISRCCREKRRPYRGYTYRYEGDI